MASGLAPELTHALGFAGRVRRRKQKKTKIFGKQRKWGTRTTADGGLERSLCLPRRRGRWRGARGRSRAPVPAPVRDAGVSGDWITDVLTDPFVRSDQHCRKQWGRGRCCRVPRHGQLIGERRARASRAVGSGRARATARSWRFLALSGQRREQGQRGALV